MKYCISFYFQSWINVLAANLERYTNKSICSPGKKKVICRARKAAKNPDSSKIFLSLFLQYQSYEDENLAMVTMNFNIAPYFCSLESLDVFDIWYWILN